MALPHAEDELNLLASVPQMIGSAMAFAGSSGLFGTGKEMIASAQSVLAGVKDFPNNELIQAIVPDLKSGDPQAALAKARAASEWSMARMKAKGIDSAEKLRAQALEDCRAALPLLSKVSPQQASEYKQWAMAVADKVAMASTEGGFLGFGGERLSANEQKLLGELKTALGLT
jgi:hypothetical protein